MAYLSGSSIAVDSRDLPFVGLSPRAFQSGETSVHFTGTSSRVVYENMEFVGTFEIDRSQTDYAPYITSGTVNTVTWEDGSRRVSVDDIGVDVRTFTDVEGLALSRLLFNGDDRMLGSALGDKLYGFNGADLISGAAGNDIISGDIGSDRMRGGDGDDIFLIGRLQHGPTELIDGGSGFDRVRFTSTTSGETLRLRSDVTTVEAVTISTPNGSTAGTTALNLDASRLKIDRIQLIGNNGDNTIVGGTETDRITGHDGNDVLFGGGGADFIAGGAGADVFVFKFKSDSPTAGSADRIRDFDRSGNDTIDLSALYSGTLSYIGDDAFTGSGQVRVKDITGVDLLIEVNTGGSLAPDLVIRLENTSIVRIGADDFAL